MSKLSMLEDLSIFKPTSSVDIVVKLMQVETEEFPLNDCDVCQSMLAKSEILSVWNRFGGDF